jgi:hypothetical protein
VTGSIHFTIISTHKVFTGCRKGADRADLTDCSKNPPDPLPLFAQSSLSFFLCASASLRLCVKFCIGQDDDWMMSVTLVA